MLPPLRRLASARRCLSQGPRLTDEQWLRAEILGAFFNAVFLIALCVTIILDAAERFLDPPNIDNPKLILIVGCTGLASNLVGFFVLGGHGHSHGPGDHSHGDHDDHDHEHGHGHSHDEVAAAEEGRFPGSHGHLADDGGPAMDALPHVALARANDDNKPSEGGRRLQFADVDAGQNASRSGNHERRRANSIKHSRLQSIDDLSLYPASFRQNIIDRSRSNVDDCDASSTTSNDDAAVNENTPLTLGSGNGAKNGASAYGATSKAAGNGGAARSRRDSVVHNEHNHSKPRKAGKKGHGHSHDDMGMNAMVLHVIGDALGNVGVIVTALIIWLTDWPGKHYADPAVSLFITAIILKSCLPLTSATAKILLQATPDQIDIQEIKEDIQALPGVMSCHHVHVWQLSDTKIVASMHIQVAFPITEEDGEKYMALAKQARKCLHAYGIHSATIQPEFCIDQSCNHLEGASLDGANDGAAPHCNPAEETCLLECIDDCVGQGCCPKPPSRDGSTTSHASNQPSHSHNHDHGHDHGHNHNHDHGHH